jgi:hypothetical protein
MTRDGCGTAPLPTRKQRQKKNDGPGGTLNDMQAKVGAAMQEAGVTEDDIMRVLLEDDWEYGNIAGSIAAFTKGTTSSAFTWST